MLIEHNEIPLRSVTFLLADYATHKSQMALAFVEYRALLSFRLNETVPLNEELTV